MNETNEMNNRNQAGYGGPTLLLFNIMIIMIDQHSDGCTNTIRLVHSWHDYPSLLHRLLGKDALTALKCHHTQRPLRQGSIHQDNGTKSWPCEKHCTGSCMSYIV